MSDWVVRLIEQSGYLGIGFLMFLETVFPPIPSEVIMPVAGVAAGQGKLELLLGSSPRHRRRDARQYRLVPRRPRARHRSAAADHRSLGPLADDQLARSAARRALVPQARHCLRLARPAGADRPQPGVGPGRAARDALPQLLHRLDHRHRRLDRDPRRRRLSSWARIIDDIDKVIGPASNAILVVLVARATSIACGPTATSIPTNASTVIRRLLRRADGRGDRRRATARRRPRYRFGSTTGWHGRAVPEASADRPRPPANGSRNCGAARAASGCRQGPADARRAHRPPHQVGIERPAARPDEQRHVARPADTGMPRHRRRSPRAPPATIGTTRVLPRLPVTRSVCARAGARGASATAPPLPASPTP